MDRTEKAEAVSSLNATLASAASVVVVRNLGMTVAQSTVLRQQMRAQMEARMAAGEGAPAAYSDDDGSQSGGRVIEGEVIRADDPPRPPER